tara:strand:+ start:1319 stop:1645 length:327 start_codon:yes stop_codon:yes gene_type:complete
MTVDDLTPILVAIVGGGGLWGFLSIKSKQNHELKLQEKDTSGEFKENLMERIKVVSSENKDLHKRVQDLQDKLMEVSIELAAGNEKIKHLESEINLYEMQKKASLKAE